MLDHREVRFLRQSNALDQAIEVSDPVASSGHGLAWVRFRRRAQRQEPLQVDDLTFAHRAIMEERATAGLQVPTASFGVPLVGGAELQGFVEQMADDIRVVAPHHDLMLSIHVAGGYGYLLESMRPFAQANGLIGRLVANYVLLSLGQPLVVFPESIVCTESRIPAGSIEMMRIFVADAFRREVVCPGGHDGVNRQHSSGFSDFYSCSDCGREFIIEWHELSALYEAAL